MVDELIVDLDAWFSYVSSAEYPSTQDKISAKLSILCNTNIRILEELKIANKLSESQRTQTSAGGAGQNPIYISCPGCSGCRKYGNGTIGGGC